MSEELGRPSYKIRPAAPPGALPPMTIEDAASPKAPKPPRSPKPSKAPNPPKSPKPAAKVRRQEDPPAEADRPAYARKPGRSIGYVLWQVLRFTVLVVFKLVRVMIRIALSPFHAAG